MSRLVVPYGIRLQEDGRVVVFPVADVMMRGREDEGVRASFYIDSGATTTVLPLSDAEALGIDLSCGKRVTVRGISGMPLIGVTHRLSLTLAEITFRAPVIFAGGNDVPRILGREGVFSRFAILFAESKRKVVFLENRSQAKIINHLIA